MEPLLPDTIDEELEELGWQVREESASLGHGLPQPLIESVAEFLLLLNSFYTNSMEGNPSRLKDIEAALRKEFKSDIRQRNYQLEHVAHINTQNKLLSRIRAEPNLKITDAEFIQWLHHSFYSELPEEMRFALTESGEKVQINPGEIRDHGVVVGHHDLGPTTAKAILEHLRRFNAGYDPDLLNSKNQIVALAASHHRLLWIHPFADGNGRVARLFTVAFMNKIGLASNLWTINRYFARNRKEYDANLEMADRPPRNSYDGRGPLSREDLVRFCKYFLMGCRDQIQFMNSTLSLNKLLKPKFKIFLMLQLEEKKISKSAATALEAIFSTGEITRGDVKNICQVKVRRSTAIIKELVESGLVSSPSAYGNLRLKITSDMAKVIFPDLQ